MKMPGNKPMEAESEKVVTNGPILVLLATILLVLLGALYYWFTILNANPTPAPTTSERPTREENNEPESTTAEAQADTLQVVSTSDEIEAIEADVEATNLDSLDAELNAIDAELDAALQ
jgi:hypothetical protein